jgi:hypothetical protein
MSCIEHGSFAGVGAFGRLERGDGRVGRDSANDTFSNSMRPRASANAIAHRVDR